MRSSALHLAFASSPRRSAVALLLLVGVVAGSAPVAAAPGRGEPLLDGWYERWQRRLEPLFEERERRVWEQLVDDRQRELFIDGFWRARGPAAVERYRDNLAALHELRVLSESQAQALLLAGKPTRRIDFEGCGDRLRRLELWHWDRWHVERQAPGATTGAVNLVFVQTSNLDQHSWQDLSPQHDERQLGFGEAVSDGSLLDQETIRDCLGPERHHLLRESLRRGGTVERLVEYVPWPAPEAGWLEELATRLEAAREPIAAVEVELNPVAAYGELTVIEGRARIPIARLNRDPSGQLFERVTIVVDLYRRSRHVGSGTVTHLLSGVPPRGDAVELSFYRRLRPGLHTFDLRIADAAERPLFRRLLRVEVPAPETVERSGSTKAMDGADVARLTRDEVVAFTTFPRVELRPPRVLSGGSLEVEAMTVGGPISAVEFLWRGEALLLDREPPFAVQLAAEGETGVLEARALSPRGTPLATARRQLSAPGEPFAIELGDPVTRDGGVVAPVAVAVPAGRRLHSLACYLDETLVLTTAERATLCPVPTVGFDLSWLRAVAVLDDGERREEVLVVSRRPQERVEVELRELLVTVHDDRGRPVAGLGADDFLLQVAGEPRTLEHFEVGDPMPLHLAVLMDTSSSMGRRVRHEGESTSRFFERVLTPGDRAALLAFNHDVRRLAPFSADPRALDYGVRGVRAWGSTRLWDGIVFSLHQFRGLGERRALVVLSDGADVESTFTLDGVIAEARRAGVSVYPVALTADERDLHRELDRLARETGGTFFRAQGVDTLDSVYERIETLLRSRYRLSYRPKQDEESSDLEVRVRQPGLAVRRLDPGGEER